MNSHSTSSVPRLRSPSESARRIQVSIDRRLYRRKYNAEQVLASFSASVREKVDLDLLAGSVLEMIEETMQPEHVPRMLRKVDRQAREGRIEENSP